MAAVISEPATPCVHCPLRRLSAFASNTPEELAFIQQFKQGELRLEAGAMLSRERERTGKLFTLLDGWAIRFRTLANGSRQILSFLLPGDFIGLQEKVDDNARDGVQVLTAARVCVFPANGLWNLYQAHASLAYDVTWLAAHEELIVDENLVSVGRRTAPQRLAMLLIHLFRRAESLGMKAEDGSIPFPITQQHMADALGLSLVHTNKTLAKMQAAGWYHMTGGRLHVDRPAKMGVLAEYFSLPLRGRPLI